MSTKLTLDTATGQFSSLAKANELEDRDGLYAYTCSLTFAIILIRHYSAIIVQDITYVDTLSQRLLFYVPVIME